ncbi:uncharacterized protein G2W53_007992 [Senna tora]|uniref:Uncharacterized protein n=1 Tax=Senna tora TaxID=362788 RepID=A0A834X7P5_9FABA|nr:uncharacterized protein G2W53_007992 [Senna tora]
MSIEAALSTLMVCCSGLFERVLVLAAKLATSLATVSVAT